MSAPKVSIVTPSYNQAEFLERTILSVLGQSYGNVEYIVIDGGSTDGSVGILEKYGSRIAYWASKPDAGQAAAINDGFARATGKYLAWLNSDDTLRDGAIARAVGFLEAHPGIDFVYGDILVGEREESARLLGGRATTLEEMLLTFEVPIPQQGSMWTRSLWERTGPLEPRWHVVLDREFFLRVARHAEMAYLPEVLGFFRLHSHSKSVAQQVRWMDELPAMYEELFAAAEADPRVRPLRDRALGIVFAQCAALALKSGSVRRSRDFLARALARDPLFWARKGMRAMVGNYLAGKLRRLGAKQTDR